MVSPLKTALRMEGISAKAEIRKKKEKGNYMRAKNFGESWRQKKESSSW